jgi:carbon dioxide concentrating mechanism protein CcmO
VSQPSLALGLLEVGSWTASIAALDAAEKAADVRVVQVEVNDLLGASMKLVGGVSDLSAGLAAAESTARAMKSSVVARLIARPGEGTLKLVPRIEEYNPLIEQNVVHIPREVTMSESTQAIGLIETQGFTAVIEAIDHACKAANVEVAGREKLGGGYICVVIRGDVAAVKAAVEAGKTKVEGLGKLIAAHVIARPSSAVMGLLPKA